MRWFKWLKHLLIPKASTSGPTPIQEAVDRIQQWPKVDEQIYGARNRISVFFPSIDHYSHVLRTASICLHQERPWMAQSEVEERFIPLAVWFIGESGTHKNPQVALEAFQESAIQFLTTYERKQHEINHNASTTNNLYRLSPIADNLVALSQIFTR
jgi:hypothetical protein